VLVAAQPYAWQQAQHRWLIFQSALALAVPDARPGRACLRGCRSGHGRDLGDGASTAGLEEGPHVPAAVVVLDAPRALLLLGDGDLEVVVEVAAER